MATNQISATLTQADRDAALAAITTLKEKLPFLVDLTVEERKALPKMGDKSRAFVSKALEVATQNPDFLPRSFNLEEMRKDVQLFEAMYAIVMAVTQLQELLDDTYTTVGSEAYSAALQVYNYAKASVQGAGLETVVDEMGQRFARKAKKTKPQSTSV
ncbi:hypothetical protein H6F93_05820 [Leptolyngbya sp. FACHB-671]|uniref:hypothetical protein n=1 Tax=Leptolyngbya sp. FACHB-671 TaxID=2692812 RepID=UPI001687BB01|nr:hypothetical protein [Leptolyngbya sp. FACHB-671]MBD2067051.1 hypothetical protein [Leptolyngbya sp. FACHB-671]